ncbi:flagellar biosynthesis anti-sigma factor FlgM [Aminipila luticellarii]|uniref:Flagellar biosynthesis anti-sigma factor FlgM n=1 Tax=Aminipila luticellarii TaxID=2507160 RepID=A0A410PSR0_9FIRM|nr:flagellar biosynthesis anti-sigma factor FlgM [Aminipila luticellarii]QAT42017.1 flagellar biosynthesis anti-sigma factor FlgM [Aminipila luticellarii]
MKITGNYFNSPINKKNIPNQTGTGKVSFSENLRNRDSITISASKEQVAEAQFVDTLRSRISAEVKAGVSDEKLESLKEQIAKGEYELNANEIAKKILLTETEC